MPNFSSRIIIRALISSRVISSSSLKGLCRPGANQGGTDQVTECCDCGAMYAATVLRSAEGAAFPSGYIIAYP